MKHIITLERIKEFEEYLAYNEKAKNTIKKYGTILRNFANWLHFQELDKTLLLSYREELLKEKKAQTVNGYLSAINAYLDYYNLNHLRVKFLKVQRQSFLSEDKELTMDEYKRLLQTAKSQKKERLYYLILTLCGTGIRVSELAYITVESVHLGKAEIRNKGKTRIVLMPKELRKQLQHYMQEENIKTGSIFITKTGKKLDRSNIAHEMKTLCKQANVNPKKVFPHNFRHLFARTFYAVEKNLSYLADVLGHSQIETTRIYVAVSATVHEKTLNKMNLII